MIRKKRNIFVQKHEQVQGPPSCQSKTIQKKPLVAAVQQSHIEQLSQLATLRGGYGSGGKPCRPPITGLRVVCING